MLLECQRLEQVVTVALKSIYKKPGYKYGALQFIEVFFIFLPYG